MSELNKPSHYHYGGMDVIGFGEINYPKAEMVGFYRMNILKYVHRYHDKNGLDDLMKAKDYLNRLIELEKGND